MPRLTGRGLVAADGSRVDLLMPRTPMGGGFVAAVILRGTPGYEQAKSLVEAGAGCLTVDATVQKNQSIPRGDTGGFIVTNVLGVSAVGSASGSTKLTTLDGEVSAIPCQGQPSDPTQTSVSGLPYGPRTRYVIQIQGMREGNTIRKRYTMVGLQGMLRGQNSESFPLGACLVVEGSIEGMAANGAIARGGGAMLVNQIIGVAAQSERLTDQLGRQLPSYATCGNLTETFIAGNRGEFTDGPRTNEQAGLENAFEAEFSLGADAEEIAAGATLTEELDRQLNPEGRNDGISLSLVQSSGINRDLLDPSEFEDVIDLKVLENRETLRDEEFFTPGFFLEDEFIDKDFDPRRKPDNLAASVVVPDGSKAVAVLLGVGVAFIIWRFANG